MVIKYEFVQKINHIPFFSFFLFFFIEILNKTVAKHERLLKTSAYEQPKLSSAVALLEAAYKNLSKSNCGKTKFTFLLSNDLVYIEVQVF